MFSFDFYAVVNRANEPRRTIGFDTSADLDMKTLVWTRREAFPLKLLESRMRCPRCGSRKVTVLFEVPNQPKSAAGRFRY